MRTQKELKELFETYEQEMVDRTEQGKPIGDLIPLIEFIRAQIREEPSEPAIDPEPGDSEPSEPEDG